MATISTITSTATIDGAIVELNKVTRRDGVVSRYEVEFVERDFGYTLFRGISENSARMWFDKFVKDVMAGWRP
jgi:hypothetical protein